MVHSFVSWRYLFSWGSWFWGCQRTNRGVPNELDGGATKQIDHGRSSTHKLFFGVLPPSERRPLFVNTILFVLIHHYCSFRDAFTKHHAQDVSSEEWNRARDRILSQHKKSFLIRMHSRLFSMTQFQVFDWFDSPRSPWRISFGEKGTIATGNGFVVKGRTQGFDKRQYFVVASACHVPNQTKSINGQKVTNGHDCCHETGVSQFLVV